MGMCVYACMHTWVRRLLNETQRLKSALTVLKDEQLASDEQQRAMRQLGAVRSMEDTKWLASSPEPRIGRVSLQERTPAASRGPGCDASGHARLATSAPGLAAPAPDSLRTTLALHRSDQKTELAATMLQRLEENRQSGATASSPCASSRRGPAKLRPCVTLRIATRSLLRLCTDGTLLANCVRTPCRVGRGECRPFALNLYRAVIGVRTGSGQVPIGDSAEGAEGLCRRPSALVLEEPEARSGSCQAYYKRTP